jgi:hypothetical protein
LKLQDLQEFIDLYQEGNSKRKETYHAAILKEDGESLRMKRFWQETKPV